MKPAWIFPYPGGRGSRRTRRVVFSLLAVTVFMIQGIALAGEVGRGGYAGSFMRLGLGARSLAMGGGSSALGDDGYTLYYNPAGLVFLEQRWVTGTLNSMALDRHHLFVGYAQALGGGEKGPLRAGFALGWINAGVDNIDARDYNGNDTGDLTDNEHCFTFSFAMNPVPVLGIGISGKLLYHRFGGIMEDGGALVSRGFGFDIGLQLRPFSWLRAGIVKRDIGAKYTWDTQELYERGTQTVNRFPRVFQGGLAGSFLKNRLLVALDIEIAEYFPARIFSGVQWEGLPGLFLRAGLKTKELTAGAGYRKTIGKMGIQMDYGYIPDPVAPRGNHVFSWSFVF